jgi:sugar phosphate isomerase/epimerase
MRPLQVLPSTTSHKHEPLVPTLEIFARLGLLDLDLNLSHMVEAGQPPEEVVRALETNGQRVWVVSGGWCDFFDSAPKIEETFTSVARQVALVRQFGVDRLRLFFGRLTKEAYSEAARETIAANIQRVADLHPDLLFLFENHDGASSEPAVCREVLLAADRPNVGLNFDPINFEHAGVRAMDALTMLRPLIAHVHLKGMEAEGFCEFGAGDVDLKPMVKALIAGGYRGGFTAEYEGRFDRTLRLYEGLKCARATVAALASPSDGAAVV